MMCSGPLGRPSCSTLVVLHAKHLTEFSIAEERHCLPLWVVLQELSECPPLSAGIIPVESIPIVEDQDSVVQQKIGEKSQHGAGRTIKAAIDNRHCCRTELMLRFEVWAKSVV